ncbi:MAG: hypothetical protein ACM3U2_03900 [Deltaproteobacteria bacterium]|jgi:hypothetical protein
MVSRMFALTLAMVTLAWLVATYAIAGQSFDGTIEKAGAGKIEIKDNAGKVHSFSVDAAAKITLDGKAVKLEDLKAGASATVATEVKNNQTLAVMITARSKL